LELKDIGDQNFGFCFSGKQIYDFCDPSVNFATSGYFKIYEFGKLYTSFKVHRVGKSVKT
jgi:regulator of sigma D